MGLNQDLNGISHEAMCVNIVAVYNRAVQQGTDVVSRDWYAKARRDCEAMARANDVDVDLVIDVVAVLSPGMPWIWNIANAQRVFNYQPTTAYPANVRKARALIAGADRDEVVRGPKVTAFADNIRSSGTDEAVTIDKWAIKVATNWRHNFGQGPTAKQHRRLTQAYQKVAEYLNVKPPVLQAITWQQVRIENGFDDADWKVIDDYNPYS